MEWEYRKTCKRKNTPGHAHYLTFSCFKRRPFLVKDRSRLWLIDAIWRAKVKHDFLLWAWVIMPEHVHLLIRPMREVYDISAILKGIKKPVTDAAVKHVRVDSPMFLDKMIDVQPNGTFSYRFWQRGGGYDTNLWTAKYIKEKIVYIHQNPVRRGLVKDQLEWKWSSAQDFGKMREPLLPLDFGTIPI